MSNFFERDSSNLRPSELPADTIIDAEGWGRWLKLGKGRWQEVDVPDAFFPEYIYDVGPEEWRSDTRTLLPSDKVFTNFKIVAYPAALVERIAEDLAQEIRHDWHTNDTAVSVIRLTINDMKKSDESRPKDLTPELARELGMVRNVQDDKEGTGSAAPGTDEVEQGKAETSWSQIPEEFRDHRRGI